MHPIVIYSVFYNFDLISASPGMGGGDQEAKNLPIEAVLEAAITIANERVLTDDLNSGLGSEPAFVFPACPNVVGGTFAPAGMNGTGTVLGFSLSSCGGGCGVNTSLLLALCGTCTAGPVGPTST